MNKEVKTITKYLQKQGFIMALCLRIEQTIKELIILQKNPDIIDDYKKGIRGPLYINERKDYGKKSFGNKLCTDFYISFEKTFEGNSVLNIKNEVEWIRNLRDFLFHSISRDGLTQMLPKDQKRYREMETFFSLDNPNRSRDENHYDKNPWISLDIEKNYDEICSKLSYFDTQVLEPIMKHLKIKE